MDFNDSGGKRKLFDAQRLIILWKILLHYIFPLCLSLSLLIIQNCSFLLLFYFSKFNKKKWSYFACQTHVSESQYEVEPGYQKLAKIPSGLQSFKQQLNPSWCIDSCFGFMELLFASSFRCTSSLSKTELSNLNTLPKSLSKATSGLTAYRHTHFNLFRHKSLDVHSWRCLESVVQESLYSVLLQSHVCPV